MWPRSFPKIRASLEAGYMRVIRVQGSKARDPSWVPQEGLRKLSISMSGNYLPFIPPSSSPVPDTTRLQIPSACSSSLVAGPNLATADELHVWLVTPIHY